MYFFAGGAIKFFSFVGGQGGKVRSCYVVGDQGYEVPVGRAFGGEWICLEHSNFGSSFRRICFGCDSE